MTHEEMADAIQGVISLLDGALDPNEPAPWRVIGEAQGLLGNILVAALEAEPLAEGWLCGIEYGDDEWDSPTAIHHATFSRKRSGWAGEKFVTITERKP